MKYLMKLKFFTESKKYIKKYEKVGDDYSNWKKYQLFVGSVDNNNIHICITTKDVPPEYGPIRKIYEYDSRDKSPKIKPIKAFYFSPNLDNPDIIFQSDSFDEIYKEFKLAIKNIETHKARIKYNI